MNKRIQLRYKYQEERVYSSKPDVDTNFPQLHNYFIFGLNSGCLLDISWIVVGVAI